jgi:hypothetical protein
MSSELHDLLGDGEAAAGAVASFTAPVEESPTVLKTDRWTKRAGARLADQWAEAGVEGVTKDNVDLASDAIETLLSSAPKMAERPVDAHRARWWKQLMESPECTALRARTVCSPAVAEIAAAELAKQWVAYAAENPDPSDADDESPEQSVNRMRSTREALAEAAQAAEDAEAVGAGLGLGAGLTLEGSRLAQYTRRLRMSTNLAGIMRMAGRFIAKAQRLQRQRTTCQAWRSPASNCRAISRGSCRSSRRSSPAPYRSSSCSRSRGSRSGARCRIAGFCGRRSRWARSS